MKHNYNVLGNGETKEFFQCEYQDNIEEILKQENVKEYLENKKEINQNEININNAAIDRNKRINRMWIMGLVLSITIFECVFLLLNIYSPIRGINVLSLTPIIFGAIMSVPVLCSSIIGINEFKRENKALELELKELEKQLSIAKNKIGSLRENKTKDNYGMQMSKNDCARVCLKDDLKEINNYLHNFSTECCEEEKDSAEKTLRR